MGQTTRQDTTQHAFGIVGGIVGHGARESRVPFFSFNNRHYMMGWVGLGFRMMGEGGSVCFLGERETERQRARENRGLALALGLALRCQGGVRRQLLGFFIEQGGKGEGNSNFTRSISPTINLMKKKVHVFKALR